MEDKVEINFICPVCNKEIADKEADDLAFMEDKQGFIHISCYNKDGLRRIENGKENGTKEDSSKEKEMLGE